MSIQVTLDITRPNAEKKALEAYLRKHKDKLMSHIKTMTDNQLERYIDELFYNYNIIKVKID